jgi:hypothetical protein
VQRSIDSPDGVWSNIGKAASWLGISVSVFRTEKKRVPHLLPFTKIGNAEYWHWIDLVRYSMLRGGVPMTPEEAEKEAQEEVEE